VWQTDRETAEGARGLDYLSLHLGGRCRVQDVGCGVQGVGCRVEGGGSRFLEFAPWMYTVGCRVQGVGRRVWCAGCRE
jgi:hypothetical protein